MFTLPRANLCLDGIARPYGWMDAGRSEYGSQKLRPAAKSD
jgi:hypothetical protein